MRSGKVKIKLLCIVSFVLLPYFLAVGVATASGSSEHEAGIGSLLHPAVNFALYATLLVFIYKKYLRSKIKDAATNTASYIQRSLAQLTAAETDAASVAKRKSRLEDEKQGIVLQYQKEGEIQKDRIITGAIERSDVVVNGVFAQAERELAQAKIAVQREVFKQVLSDAGQRFRDMPPEDDRKVRAGVMEAMINMTDL